MKKIIICSLIILAIVLALIFFYYNFYVANETLIEVEANEEKGFNFNYYLYIPKGIKKDEITYLLIEPNNTGRVSDDHSEHDEYARNMVSYGICKKIANELKVPLLVPAFDRPESDWQMYTHSLDRDTIMRKQGEFARIDLQLIYMIEDAKLILQENHVRVQDKVLLDGFSASGSFVNRFTVLHPQIVKAVSAGGVNCMPILPIETSEGIDLIYPIGIYDIEKIADIQFAMDDYLKVSQFIYMGSLDDNDTLPYDDAFNEVERELITQFLGLDMHKRWDKSKLIYNQLGIHAKMIMYEGIGHTINDEVFDDIIQFFKSNIS